MAVIDLNADLGEEIGDDDAMLTLVTSANIACGFHAGNPATLAATCRSAATGGIRIGAQVSYPDRSGFGRRFIDVAHDDLVADVVYQIGALTALAYRAGSTVSYVKPHGALYNTVVHHEHQSAAVVEAVRSVDVGLAVMGLPGSRLLRDARAAGLPTITEAFADRGYRPDGTLVPRGEPGALITDSADVARRVVRMVTSGTVTAVDGTDISVAAQSICLHGDTPGAVHHAQAVRLALTDAGVTIAPVG
ncbi:LamB/YcsF family protein [Gordonia sp. CPCC 205333]|uniref:LamB/YcsF family protein n=1 Tax=Gordonia sp. CPCC 205333 TaxID=3140790 RepID=UPI003AF3420F